MFLAIQVLTITILVAVAMRMFGRHVRAVARGFAAGTVSNAAVMIGWTFARAGTFFYGTTAPPWLLSLYSVLVVAVGLAILALLRLSRRHITHKEQPWRLRELFSVLGGAILGALIALFTFVPKAIADSVDEVTADQILFIITQGNGETTPERALEFTNLMVAPTVWLALVGACIGLISSDIVLDSRARASLARGNRGLCPS